MANKIYLNSHFGFREDLLENWERENPVLERGEISVVRDGTNGNWLKIGDGTTKWQQLSYKKGPQGLPGDNYILTETDKKEIADMVPGIGEVTEAGGEIFNDYQNNTAGLKGFNILYYSQDGNVLDCVLDSNSGISVGDVISVQLGNNYDYVATVTNTRINELYGADGNITTEYGITATMFESGLTLPTDKTGTLWVPQKPYIGTVALGKYAFSANIDNKASAKGAAAFGEANVAGGKRSFCAGGEANFAGYCGFVTGQGNKIKGVRSAGVGWNNDIATQAEYAFVAGTNNKVRSNGTAVFGNGNTDCYNSALSNNFITGISNTIKDGSQGTMLVTGRENKAKGDSTICGGQQNDVEASFSIVNGQYNTVKGSAHLVAGCRNNTVDGDGNTVFSGASEVSGSYNLVTGHNHTVAGEDQAYFGVISERDDNAALIVGNGYIKENVGFIRQNAFKVMKDGTAVLQKSGTGDNNVVIYSQLKTLLDEIETLKSEINQLKNKTN